MVSISDNLAPEMVKKASITAKNSREIKLINIIIYEYKDYWKTFWKKEDRK